VLWPESAGFDLQVRVCADAGEPLSGAEVYFFGRGQTRAVTDSNGEARVSLIGETPASVSRIYVKPKADYWERTINNPLLDPNEVYNLPMKPLSEWYPGFPAQELDGWGLAAMNLSQLAAGRYNGAGIKVAIVDSGAAVTHVQLQGQVQKGVDLVGGSPESWDQDTIMHGTHCAGVIAARDVGQGIRGIAPEAQLFIYKIFPGGEFDTLIRALEECIREQVDLVNLSLGAGSSSVFVNEWLQEAKNQGIACIVAAGNTSGPVQFPASSGSVLAVSAIGKVGQFPADTFHSEQVSGAPDSSGYFSAKFTCFGPQVGVCAPGVGILSTVPPNDYAAWDGTSMAAPHVTGLAALILAHHPDFQSAPYNQRSAQRVDRLFRILRETSQPLNLGQLRTGAGLPDAQSAISAVLGADHAGGSETNSGSPGESALDRLFEKARASGISSTNGGQ
jgi:subtilisin family serine protease